MKSFSFKGVAVLEVLAVSFVVGNAIAWSMGAYPRSFDEIPYDKEEQAAVDELKEYLSENPDDDLILTEYGGILSEHNQLEPAEEVLEKAVELNPDNSLGKAWLATNRMKQAGASIDLTYGLWKLYKMGQAEDLMNEAVENDPENFVVRSIRLFGFGNVGSVLDTHGDLCGERQKFDSRLEKDDGDPKQTLRLALATYFSSNPECNSDSENERLARMYLEQAGEPENASNRRIKTATQKRIEDVF